MILGAGTAIYMLYAAVRLYLNNNTSFAIIFAVFWFNIFEFYGSRYSEIHL